MNRNEVIEMLRTWDSPLPRVINTPLADIHSALLNDNTILSPKWLRQEEWVILTDSEELTKVDGTLDINHHPIMSDAFAIGKVVDFVNVNDGIMHRYSEIELITFFAKDALESIDDFHEASIMETEEVNEAGVAASVSRWADRIGLILGNILKPTPG